MDKQLLQVFVTVVEKENFTRAAEELHMTQPAVSQYIKTLEKIVGTKLLERSNKYVRLNKAGEIVYHHANEILGHYKRMQYLVDDLLHKAGGNISIGASYTFGEYILPHIIAYLNQEYPLIKPSITIGNTKDITEKVAGHQLDIGVIEGESTYKDLYVEPFAKDIMSVIVSANHPLADKVEIELDDLIKETWIVRELGSGTREAAERMFGHFQFSPQSKMEFGSTQIIKESVEAGLGVTILSNWTIRKELALGTLKAKKIKEGPFTRNFSFVTDRTLFFTKATEIFIETLRKYDDLSVLFQFNQSD